MKKNRKNSQSVPLSETAYQKIKNLIVSTHIGPGEQVDESQLADTLAIGRTPIREALFRLVAENLVEVVRGRGFFVKDITLRDTRDLFEAMLIMERSAVVLAARRIQPGELEELRQINDDLRQSWLERDYLNVTLLNSRFHRRIYKAADNAFLYTYFDNLQTLSQRLAYICFSRKNTDFDLEAHAELTMRDHQLIIDALGQTDEVAAVKAMTEHVKLFHRRVNRFTSPTMDDLDAMSAL
jgi:DNA-binding GntR family transcriptional regulator